MTKTIANAISSAPLTLPFLCANKKQCYELATEYDGSRGKINSLSACEKEQKRIKTAVNIILMLKRLIIKRFKKTDLL
ncbi:MAG: hypothetical protein Alis3KO_31220 [Aliiglaciecola sp.]